MARPGLWVEQTGSNTCPVSTCALTVGHSLNADRAECLPSKAAAFGRNAASLTTKCQSKVDEEIRLADKSLLERLGDLRLKCTNWT